MEILRLSAIVFLLVLISSHAYNQVWKQYGDSAQIYSDKKSYDTAIVFYNKSKDELKKDSAATNSYANICSRLGNLYIEQNKYDSAEMLLLEALQVRSRASGKENSGYAEDCYSLGRLYNLTGKYEKAEPLLLEAKQVREKVLGREHPDYATTCNTLGLTYNYLGQYQKAELLLMEAKQIREKVLGEDNLDYAKSCNNLGFLYYNMGQYYKTEPLYIKAKEIREKILGKEHPDYASSCNNLAILYVDMGDYEKAEPLYMEAIRIWVKIFGKEDRYYATGCNNLAILYMNMGNYEKAEPLYVEARQLWAKIFDTNHPDYATSCNNLANLYSAMRKYEKAKPLYLEAKQIREKMFGKEHPDYAQSCLNLAINYMEAGEFEKAEPLFLETKQIWQKVFGKENPDYALSCNDLGVLYTRMGKYEKAEPYCLEAQKINEQIFGKGDFRYTENCLNLGNLYWNMRTPEKANTFYAEAFQSQSIQVNNVFQFTNEYEKQSYLKKTEDLENYFLSFNKFIFPHAYSGLSYNVSLSSRNLILSSSQHLRNEIYNSADTGIKNKYDTWIKLREQVAYWNAKPITERAAYVKDIELQADSLEKELTRLSSDFKEEQVQNENSWSDIQQHLEPGEAAVEFIQFHFYNGRRWTDSTYYVALLLTKTSKEPVFIPLFESRQLNNIIKTGGTYQTITAIYKNDKANTAYNLIWKPIDKYLDDITKIYFAPAGLLYRISLQALPVNNQQLLGDKYQLVQLNTTASVTDQFKNRIDTTDKIYLYGGIQYDVDSALLKQIVVAYHHDQITHFVSDELTRGSSWQYLPGTEKEIHEIDSLGQQKKYAVFSEGGNGATEESIKALNGNASPVVLHIATHGFFYLNPVRDTSKNNFASGNVFRQSDDPLFRSGLLFAGANNAWKGKQIAGVEDGILTAYEVSNLYLPNTKLVVLSACETGLGEIQGNEGVYGLQRAFKIAGVENLIMSLWKVPDKETAEFMKLFYENLFDKQLISDAFYNAQTVMKNKYRNEPYKWAAWILVR